MGRAQADRNFSEELYRLKRFWRVIPPLLRVVDAAAVALYPSALEVAERARLVCAVTKAGYAAYFLLSRVW